MFKLRKVYLISLVLILAFSQIVYSQDGEVTQEPIITEAPVATEEPTIAPTEEIIVVTEEIIPPTTEEPIIVTEEASAIPTEAASLEVTEIVTEAPIATELPQITEEVQAAPSGNATEMLLKYNPLASEESIQAMLSALGAIEIERLPQIGVIKAMIPLQVANMSAAATTLQSNRLASLAGLSSIEPNYNYSLALSPNDPHFVNNLQPQLQDGAMAYSIYMQTAWDLSTRDGQGVMVAVVDSGVDLQHPEFAGRLVAGWDFYNDDNNPDDDNGHGTHVAGVIAARTNNNLGIAGIAFNSTILPVKVCDPSGLSCPTYETAAGIIYAVDRGAKVINISLGGPAFSSTIQGATDYAISRNVVVVAAAGNSGDNDINTDEIFYPASNPGVISVGSVQPNGDIAPSSNSNSMITVAAPGVNILSTWPLAGAPASAFGLGYEYASGTSMASPHVAGLAALLIADNVATTPATVRDALICSGLDMGDVGFDNSFGNGLIQADYAMNWRGNSATCQRTVANDLIQNATNITAASFTVRQAVNTRSVTESPSDPTICCIQPNQSLWYKFTPPASGMYYFSTYGSSYDTLLGIYTGMPGNLIEIAGNNDFNSFVTTSGFMISLTKGVVYYVQLGTSGADVQGIAQLNINPALRATTLQQENIAALRYTGTWNRIAQTGSSGGFIYTTTDASATVSFLARGTELKYTRMVGPNEGMVEIWIDDNVITPTNTAVNNRSQTLTVALGATPGEWHFVTMRLFGGIGSLSVDAIQVTDTTLPTSSVTSRVNETAAQFNGAFLGGTWTNATVTGAMANNVKTTSDLNAYVQFRATGSAITIYRGTGVGTGQMLIWFDDAEFPIVVDNSIFADSPSAPYSIANLSPRERVVNVVHVGPGELKFDGASAITQASILPSAIIDERSPNLVYSGIWTRTSLPAAQAGTLTSISNTSGGGEVEFMFTGNHFCIGYQENPTGGTANIYIDDNPVPVGNINSNDALTHKVKWCSYDNGVNQLSDTVHNVTLEVPAGQNFTLDYVQAVRRTVFTSAMGYIAETNAGIFYNNSFGTWAVNSSRSTGGASFQGGNARRANITTLPGDERLSFTINGTGFVLYTSVAPAAGGWEVYVDGVLETFMYESTPENYLDLYNDWRFRPFAVAVTDLAQGVHLIELRAISVAPAGEIPARTNQFVDFDGIRVLP